MDSRVQKRRMFTMLAVNAVCLLVAAAAIVGYVTGGVVILGPVFVAAIAAGVASQVWFIVGVARQRATPAGKA
jgi:hypothetical protein